jgi:NADH-quinone oxidoreductase subunit C/D
MPDIVSTLQAQFLEAILYVQVTKDDFPTIWVRADYILDMLIYLKKEVDHPYPMLYDLTAIDEQAKNHRDGQPESRFTIVYQLLSFERNSFLRLKVPSTSAQPVIH